MARPANSLVASFAFAPIPDGIDPALHKFLEDMQRDLEAAITTLAEQGAYTTVAPPKPRDGMIRLADGTGWDPVSTGTPTYVGYRDGSWVTLE